MADNGYDIADYEAIAPEFGTMDDFDRLVAEARARGIGIVMDLVVNHTSVRAPLVQGGLRRYRRDPNTDYYIWREPGPDGGPPDDQRACFGGPAWTFVPEVGQVLLPLLQPRPARPRLAEPGGPGRGLPHDERWFDRGIAGFRMDVISLIGKDVDARIYEEGPLPAWLPAGDAPRDACRAATW